MFNPKRLSLARMRRRLTAKALAEKTGLADLTITRLEKGANVPDDATLDKLVDALSFPRDFFLQADPEEIDTGAVSFRSFTKMSAKERDAAISAGALGLQLSAWVEERFQLPEPSLIDLSYETDPEAAAAALLETKGVRIFSLAENTASVNAFSFWRDNKPYIFLNNFKTAESSIFDSAHELGHLVMHKHGDPKETRAAEREANGFASAFLMPAKDVRSQIRRPISTQAIMEAKFRWRVSAMALAYRLHAMGALSPWRYKSIIMELGKWGYRDGEPKGIARETSAIWRKVLTALWSERTTKNDIAKSLHLPVDEIEGLIWNLAGPEIRPAERELRAIK